MAATVDAEAMVDMVVAKVREIKIRQTENNLARIGRKVINTEEGHSC